MKPNDARLSYTRPLRLALVISLGLTIAVLLAACVLSGVAVHQRLIPPPAFAVQVGDVEFSGPCPPKGQMCDKYPPFYAIWRGETLPDGSILYHQVFFIYLSPTRRH